MLRIPQPHKGKAVARPFPFGPGRLIDHRFLLLIGEYGGSSDSFAAVTKSSEPVNHGLGES